MESHAVAGQCPVVLLAIDEQPLDQVPHHSFHQGPQDRHPMARRSTARSHPIPRHSTLDHLDPGSS